MIDFKPLRFTRPDVGLDAFSSMTDNLSKRYEEGEGLSQEAKDLFALYKTAPTDNGVRNEFAAQQSSKIDNLLKEYEGAYEDRRFQTEMKRIVREGASDPRLQALDETKQEYEFAKNFQRQAKANGRSVLFNNINDIRTTFDEEGNPVSGKFEGQEQLDWVKGAKDYVGNISSDSFKKIGVGSIDGLAGMVTTQGGGIDEDKLKLVSERIAEPFLQGDVGKQWLRHTEQRLGRSLNEKERTDYATQFLIASNSNQLSNNTAIDFNYISDFNKPIEQPPPDDNQVHSQAVSHLTTGTSAATEDETTFFNNPATGLDFTSSGEVGLVGTIANLFNPDNWITRTFDSKDENYRSNVETSILTSLGKTPEELLKIIKTGSTGDIQLAMMDLGIDLDDMRQTLINQGKEEIENSFRGKKVGLKELEEQSKSLDNRKRVFSTEEIINKIKSSTHSVDDLYASKLGVALAQQYKKNNGNIKENIIVDVNYKKEAEAVNKEKMTSRVLSGLAALQISGGATTEVTRDNLDDFEIGEELIFMGSTDKFNMIAGNDPRFVGADLYESKDRKTQYLIARSKPNAVDQYLARQYTSIKQAQGQEVQIPYTDQRARLIISEAQLERTLDDAINALNMPVNADPETRADDLKKIKLFRDKARLAYSKGIELAVFKNSKGEIIHLGNLKNQLSGK